MLFGAEYEVVFDFIFTQLGSSGIWLFQVFGEQLCRLEGEYSVIWCDRVNFGQKGDGGGFVGSESKHDAS